MCRLSGPDCESRWERMASIILDYNYSFPDLSGLHTIRTTCDIPPVPGPRDTERHGDTDPGLCDGGSQEAATPT